MRSRMTHAGLEIACSTNRAVSYIPVGLSSQLGRIFARLIKLNIFIVMTQCLKFT